ASPPPPHRGIFFLPPPLTPPHHDSRPRRHGCRRVRAVRQRSQLFPVIRFQLHTIIKHEIRNHVKLVESRDTRQDTCSPSAATVLTRCTKINAVSICSTALR